MDPSETMNYKQLTINVRSPSLSETLVVAASMSDTVLSVKQSLQSIHPYNPGIGSQRLIYAGKMLKDEDPLHSILNKVNESNVYIFHLVVKPGGMNKAPKPRPQTPVKLAAPEAEQNPTVTAESSSVATSPIPTTLSSSIPTPSRPSHRLSTSPPPSLLETTPGPSKPSVSNEQSAQSSVDGINQGPQVVTINGKQYLAITPAIQSQLEAYEQYLLTYQQYYTQWYQWYNANYVMHNEVNSMSNTQLSATEINGNGNQSTATNPPNAAADAEAERQRAARRTTMVWLAAKLLLLVFILTRDASIPRMIVLYLGAVVFFLYQTGQLRFIVRRVRPWNTNTEASASRDANRADDQPITRRRIIERGVYTFVASLFPSYGHDPRIAEALENAQQDEPMAGL